MSTGTQKQDKTEMARREASELNVLLSALGVTDEWRVENIKETAMNRFNVKKTKRQHIKRILDDAFEQLKEYDR